MRKRLAWAGMLVFGLVPIASAETSAGLDLARFDLGLLPRFSSSTAIAPADFRALGFTKQGYLVLRTKGIAETNSGCYVQEAVRDLVGDGEVDLIHSEECAPPPEWSRAFLEKWKPRLDPSIAFQRFPLRAGQDEFKAEIRVRKEDEEDSADVFMISSRQGEKKLGTLDSPRGYPRLAQVGGFLKSPASNRIAVIVGIPARGLCMTEPDIIDFQVFGAHLAVGFSAPPRRATSRR